MKKSGVLLLLLCGEKGERKNTVLSSIGDVERTMMMMMIATW